jgi:PAS domain S-box-containing protein
MDVNGNSAPAVQKSSAQPADERSASHGDTRILPSSVRLTSPAVIFFAAAGIALVLVWQRSNGIAAFWALCGMAAAYLLGRIPARAAAIPRLAELLESLQAIGCRKNGATQKFSAAQSELLEKLCDETRRIERMFSGLQLELDTVCARHELITTNIAASVIIRDTEGKILFCSPYTQVLTGYSLDEIYDSEDDFFERIVVEEDKPRYRRAQMVSALAEDISVKYRIQHRSGLKIWLETRLVPVCNEDGELVSIMSVAIDVTDTLSYQKQIEDQNRDLSDFAYMVSHDLKAPIFTIKGMASAVLEDHQGALGADGRELMEHIVEAAKRLEELVASVIEYSSIAAKDGQQVPVELAGVIDSVMADFSEIIKRKNASVIIAGELPAVAGSQVRLYQVFSNLIGNALKYSADERRPEITISRRRSAGSNIIIEIRDNGIGVPGDKLRDIFRPYHRAHGSQIEGSGIGLACVKKIMDGLGGSVSVTSVEGEGSTFTLSFPPSKPAPREIPQDLARCFQ